MAARGGSLARLLLAVDPVLHAPQHEGGGDEGEQAAEEYRKNEEDVRAIHYLAHARRLNGLARQYSSRHCGTR